MIEYWAILEDGTQLFVMAISKDVEPVKENRHGFMLASNNDPVCEVRY